jgi:hypothetical protein
VGSDTAPLLVGEALDEAIMRALMSSARPLTIGQIAVRGCLENRCTATDRRASVDRLVISGRVLREETPDPDGRWHHVVVYRPVPGGAA